MREIDIESWDRREHYRFFRNVAYPVYNVCFDLDATEALDLARARGISFNATMIHLSMRAVNSCENFRYRARGDRVVLHGRLHPVFADLAPGSDLFKLVVVDLEDDLEAFAARARAASLGQTEYFPLRELAGRDDFVFLSALPWIPFTGLDHTVNLARDDAIPRISWGKYRADGARIMLPYNVQVNHQFVDGVHVGRFKETLDRLIGELP